MERELVTLFEAAKKAADAANAKGILLGKNDASRCVDALTRLKTLPVNRKVLVSSRVLERLERLIKHKDRKICSSASSLLRHWRQRMAAADKDQDSLEKRANGPSSGRCIIRLKLPKTSSSSSTSSHQEVKGDPCTAPVKGQEDSRDKIRGILVEALSRVSAEVKEKSDKEKVRRCNPVEVASAIEGVMLEMMGPFNGKQKNKYRSIMYNLRDPKNPDLRRKLLLGQVTPERLIDMSTEEMASNDMQHEISQMKERAVKREEARIVKVDNTNTSVHEDCF